MSTLDNLLGPIARSGITWLSRKRLPQIEGKVNLPGLTSAVEVLRDRWGIPHIYAKNLHDLYFAQGFVHAQDRLFQMEMNRRVARGKLSELFGELSLDTDRTARTFGFNRLGCMDWANSEDDLRQIILAYTEGVNAFLEYPGKKLPVEFTLLRHTPEAWTPEDTMAFTRVMVWQLSHAWYGEVIRAQLAEKVGTERAAELGIQYPESNPLTLPKGIEFNRLDNADLLSKVGGPFLSQGKGSNSWVVSAERSASGCAVLCNDMHLLVSLPALWYEVHLNAPGMHVTGVSLPGVPMVLVGHNERIAWGMTLAFTDCEDLFIEKFDTADARRYQFEDGWRAAEVIPESIAVKGRAQPHVENVVVTHHGPVISDVIGVREQRVAVNSMALRPGKAFQGWLDLNRAGGWDDFVGAMRLIEAPQLNVCYADVEGNIGYWVTGKVPIRRKGEGDVPAAGWTGEYEWVGEVPFEAMPHALNPEQGYIVTCNHKIVPDDYPYFLGNVWMNGYRARVISETIESKGKLSFEDHCKLHTDFTCLPGKELAALAAGVESSDADVLLAQKLLKEWDGKLTANSAGGAVYEVARLHLTRAILEPSLGAEMATRYMGQGFHPLLLPTHEFYGHDTVAVLRLLAKPETGWLQAAGGRHAVLEKSLKEAIRWLRETLGADPSAWQWGKLHRVSFAHALALQKPLDQVFNRGPFPIGGDTDTPCQTAFFAHDPYDNKAWAPSFRQVVDMGDLTRSAVMYPPGQCGILGSPHYDDLIQPWLKGEYHPQLWTRQQVESQVEGKLVLEGGA